MYDVAIVGAGPAGISAALNLKLHNKSIVMFGNAAFSQKVEKSEKIANYPGVQMVSGADLNALFRKQIDEMSIDVIDKTVTSITQTRKCFKVLSGSDIFDAKSVLIATGAVTDKGYDGENDLLGKGVSYCATCDGFLYKNKTIAVFCGDRRFEHEVEYLSKLVEKLYLFAPYDIKTDLPNVIKPENKICKIFGEGRVEKIILTDNSEISLDGVFILRNSVAPAVLLKGIELQGAHIVVDRQMRTSKDGVFAAGDCTGRPYQIAKAVGEGNVAAHSILEYLAQTDI